MREKTKKSVSKQSNCRSVTRLGPPGKLDGFRCFIVGLICYRWRYPRFNKPYNRPVNGGVSLTSRNPCPRFSFSKLTESNAPPPPLPSASRYKKLRKKKLTQEEYEQELRKKSGRNAFGENEDADSQGSDTDNSGDESTPASKTPSSKWKGATGAAAPRQRTWGVGAAKSSGGGRGARGGRGRGRGAGRGAGHGRGGGGLAGEGDMGDAKGMGRGRKALRKRSELLCAPYCSIIVLKRSYFRYMMR